MKDPKNLYLICLFTTLFVACNTKLSEKEDSSLWKINSLSSISGLGVELLGNPKIIQTSFGNAVSFDGDGDRLLLNVNPLGDVTEFTIEIIFKPNDVFPNNKEPRFFHIESSDNPNRRITMELRLNDKHQWYLDAYIKSERSQFTLIDPTKIHPTGEWAHAAITYKNREFISYVNGERELAGEVDYLTIPANAKTSIGARMNQIHWFNGDILLIRISKHALAPSDFLSLNKLNKKHINKKSH